MPVSGTKVRILLPVPKPSQPLDDNLISAANRSGEVTGVFPERKWGAISVKWNSSYDVESMNPWELEQINTGLYFFVALTRVR